MSRFVETTGGVLLRVDDIVIAKPTTRAVAGISKPQPFYDVQLRNGDRYLIESLDFSRIDTAPATVPAQPGYFLLNAWPTEDAPDEPFIARYPVVAWLSEGKIAEPVIAGDLLENCTSGVSALLLPDGRVTDQMEEVWDDEAAWRKALPELLRKRR